MNEVGGDNLELVQADVELPTTKVDDKVSDVRRSLREWADDHSDRVMQGRPKKQTIRKR